MIIIIRKFNIVKFTIQKQLQLQKANRNDNAWLDIAANGFWGGRFERSYFDVRIFNPNTPSNQSLHSAFRCHDKEKTREYQQRVHEVENT